MDRLSRRQFVLGASATVVVAGCGRLRGQAQEPPKVARIGWLYEGPPDSGAWTLVDAFREGLRTLGYAEGQNLLLEYRWADGQPDRLPDLAAELVSAPVEIVVTGSNYAAQAAKQTTSTIPIVMATSGDPVGTG